MVKTGMEGWRTEKLVGVIRVKACTAPSTFPAEKRPNARKRGMCLDSSCHLQREMEAEDQRTGLGAGMGAQAWAMRGRGERLQAP